MLTAPIKYKLVFRVKTDKKTQIKGNIGFFWGGSRGGGGIKFHEKMFQTTNQKMTVILKNG